MIKDGLHSASNGQQLGTNYELIAPAEIQMRDNYITFIDNVTNQPQFRMSISPTGELIQEKFDGGSYLPPMSLTPSSGPTTSTTLPHDFTTDYIEITNVLFQILIAGQQLLRVDGNGLAIIDKLAFQNVTDAIVRANASSGQVLKFVDILTGNDLLSLSDDSVNVHLRPIIGLTASADLTSAVTLQQLQAASSQPENLQFNALNNESRVLNLASANNFVFKDTGNVSYQKISYNGTKSLLGLNDLVDVDYVDTLLTDYQLNTEKGAANGYASLDVGGKVPVAQIPSGISEIQPYSGLDITKTSALTYPSAPPIGTLFAATDSASTYVLRAADYTNALNWLKLEPSSTVASINALTGIVSIDTDDIPETLTNQYFASGMNQYLIDDANQPVNLLRLNANGTINPAQFAAELLLTTTGSVNIFDNQTNALIFRDNDDDTALLTVSTAGAVFGQTASYATTPALSSALDIVNKGFVDTKAYLKNSTDNTYFNLTSSNQAQVEIASALIWDLNASLNTVYVPIRYDNAVTVTDIRDLVHRGYVDTADGLLDDAIQGVVADVLTNTNLSTIRPDQLNSGISNAILQYNQVFTQTQFDTDAKNIPTVGYTYSTIGKLNATAGSNSRIQCTNSINMSTDDGAGLFSTILSVGDAAITANKPLSFGSVSTADNAITNLSAATFAATAPTTTASYSADSIMPKKAVSQLITEIGGGGGIDLSTKITYTADVTASITQPADIPNKAYVDSVAGQVDLSTKLTYLNDVTASITQAADIPNKQYVDDAVPDLSSKLTYTANVTGSITQPEDIPNKGYIDATDLRIVNGTQQLALSGGNAITSKLQHTMYVNSLAANAVTLDVQADLSDSSKLKYTVNNAFLKVNQSLATMQAQTDNKIVVTKEYVDSLISPVALNIKVNTATITNYAVYTVTHNLNAPFEDLDIQFYIVMKVAVNGYAIGAIINTQESNYNGSTASDAYGFISRSTGSNNQFAVKMANAGFGILPTGGATASQSGVEYNEADLYVNVSSRTNNLMAILQSELLTTNFSMAQTSEFLNLTNTAASNREVIRVGKTATTDNDMRFSTNLIQIRSQANADAANTQPYLEFLAVGTTAQTVYNGAGLDVINLLYNGNIEYSGSLVSITPSSKDYKQYEPIIDNQHPPKAILFNYNAEYREKLGKTEEKQMGWLFEDVQQLDPENRYSMWGLRNGFKQINENNVQKFILNQLVAQTQQPCEEQMTNKTPVSVPEIWPTLVKYSHQNGSNQHTSDIGFAVDSSLLQSHFGLSSSDGFVNKISILQILVQQLRNTIKMQELAISTQQKIILDLQKRMKAVEQRVYLQ